MNNHVLDMSGPEFAQLNQYIKDYPFLVVIYDKDDEIIREVKLNYGNFAHKRYLGRLSHWAWEQGYFVETSAIK